MSPLPKVGSRYRGSYQPGVEDLQPQNTDYEGQIKSLEAFLQTRRYQNQARGFGHLHRTSEGATKIFTGKVNPETEFVTHVAGLLHEKRQEKIGEILRSLKFSPTIAGNVIFSVNASQEAKYLDSTIDSPTRDILFSKGLLEGDDPAYGGAYGALRNCLFCGGSKKYDQLKPSDAIVKRLRLHTRNPNEMPSFFERIAERQSYNPLQLLRALEKQERWALDLGEKLFLDGRGRKDLETAIRKLETKTREQDALKEEAVEYIDGERYDILRNLKGRNIDDGLGDLSIEKNPGYS